MLEELVAAYPNDKMIVIAPEVEIKSSLLKVLDFQRPDQKAVEDLLKKEGLTGEQIRVVLKNHNNNLEELKIDYDEGALLDHEQAFKV